jgi:hypothetical protein
MRQIQLHVYLSKYTPVASYTPIDYFDLNRNTWSSIMPLRIFLQKLLPTPKLLPASIPWCNSIPEDVAKLE